MTARPEPGCYDARVVPAPNRAYFDRHVGRWRGRFTFAVTDAEALRRAPLAWMDRARIRVVASASMRMDTSVSYEGETVIHRSAFSQLGIPMLWGVERITLGADGRSFTLAAQHRLAPAPWRVVTFDGSGEVDASAGGARYELPFFGVPLTQTTEVRDRDLWIVHRTAFSRAEVLLRRQG